MSGYTAAAALAVAAIGTGYAVYSGERASDMQKDAQRKAEDEAQKQAKASEEATNAANRKAPDIGAIMSAAQQASKGGGGTMLTGPSGVDASAMQLGKNSLLGS